MFGYSILLILNGGYWNVPAAFSLQGIAMQQQLMARTFMCLVDSTMTQYFLPCMSLTLKVCIGKGYRLVENSLMLVILMQWWYIGPSYLCLEDTMVRIAGNHRFQRKKGPKTGRAPRKMRRQRLFDTESETESQHRGLETDTESETESRRCLSCRKEYETRDAGTCKECYEKARKVEEELKGEIDDLKAKVDFLPAWPPPETFPQVITPRFYIPIALVAVSDDGPIVSLPPIFVHKGVLVSRSPVFKAMFKNEMKESRSRIIKIRDASYDALRTFVNFMYTAEACLDEQMACDLLVLAEKYQVKHLKAYCEKFLVSKLKWDNSVMKYAFAQQYNAKNLLEASLRLITDDIYRLTEGDEYKELAEKDPRLALQICQAYISKQVNRADRRNPRP